MATRLLFLNFCLFLVYNVHTERTKDKMYETVNATAYCFKWLNGTHEFGCTTERFGNIGVIHFVETDSDIQWLLSDADSGPYIAVVNPFFFTQKSQALAELKEKNKLSGMVLISPPSTVVDYFSPEDSCPNRYANDISTCNKTPEWNPDGNSMILYDWDIPMLWVDSEDDVQAMRECFVTHNNHSRSTQSKRSLCALEIKSHMLAAVNSETCIRRSKTSTTITPVKYCDPLGDRNIFSTLYPRLEGQQEKNNSVIVILSRLDSTSLFDGLVPGVVSPVTNIVTLLTVAELLKKIAEKTPKGKEDKNVLFGLLNGESYDYIGSSKMLFDMEKGVFQSPPFSFNLIDFILELDQITDTNLYLHNTANPPSDSVQQFTTNIMKEINTIVQISKEPSLPPSSLQTFKKSKRANGVLLSSYDQAYTNNKFYHSVYDNAANIKYSYSQDSTDDTSIQHKLAEVAVSVANSISKILFTNPATVNNTRDVEDRVNELLHCYVESMNCSIFNEITNKNNLDDKPPSMYVGVYGYNNTITTLTGLALAYLSGNHTQMNETQCKNGSSELHNAGVTYIWMRGPEFEGLCVETTLNFTIAVSPAFDIDGYDWSSNQYSTWTESIWREFSSRMFLKPAMNHKIMNVSVGAGVFVLSFIIIYFINAKANVIFNQNVLGTGGC